MNTIKIDTINTIKIEYVGMVWTAAGPRGVVYTAEAEKISDKRCKVVKVVTIDGEDVQANMSRTGSKRQEYYGVGAANKEEGKTKNLSSCTILNS